MKLTTYLMALLLISNISVAQSAESLPPITFQQAKYWQILLGRDDFQDLLATVNSKQVVQWPACFSDQYASAISSEQKLNQDLFRGLAFQLMKQLEEYQSDLANMTLVDFNRSVEYLLGLRNHIAQHLSYTNLVLVDTISRVVFVNFAKRLLSEKKITDKMKSILHQFRDFHVDPILLARLIEQESGKPMIDKAQELLKIELGQSSTPTHQKRSLQDGAFFLAILSIIGGSKEESALPPAESMALAMFSENIRMAGTYDLLANRDFNLLLSRHLRTDRHIQIDLPLTALYLERSHEFNIDDDYQKIKEILALTEIEKKMFGSALNPLFPGDESSARRLIKKVHSGEIDSLTMFDFSEDNH